MNSPLGFWDDVLEEALHTMIVGFAFAMSESIAWSIVTPKVKKKLDGSRKYKKRIKEYQEKIEELEETIESLKKVVEDK